jgi:hypothetical protein
MTLFLLVAAGAIAYFAWDFRRKAAVREAATKKRFEEMFRAQPASAPTPDTSPAAIPASTVVPETKAPAAVAAPPARGRFLGQRETLLYRLLKAGIPDHEIFANVALASVAGGRNEQETRRLAQYRLDFVVCDKGMRVVAAVEFEPAGGAQAIGDQHFKVDCLKAAGINLVRINPAALPRRDEVRGLVCGQLNAAGS